jgi:hypothetical protein
MHILDRVRQSIEKMSAGTSDKGEQASTNIINYNIMETSTASDVLRALHV